MVFNKGNQLGKCNRGVLSLLFKPAYAGRQEINFDLI